MDELMAADGRIGPNDAAHAVQLKGNELPHAPHFSARWPMSIRSSWPTAGSSRGSPRTSKARAGCPTSTRAPRTSRRATPRTDVTRALRTGGSSLVGRGVRPEPRGQEHQDRGRRRRRAELRPDLDGGLPAAARQGFRLKTKFQADPESPSGPAGRGCPLEAPVLPPGPPLQERRAPLLLARRSPP